MDPNFFPNGTYLLRGQLYNITDLWFDGVPKMPKECTVEKCSLLLAYIRYLPNVSGNAFLAALFGIFLLANLGLGIYRKTWGFMVGMVFGLFLEVVGYIGRILMHNNPFTDTGFMIYIVCLTIGPAFLSGAVYLCLARIVVVYGEGNSNFKPKVYTIVFMVSDFISLVLQGAGGGLAATANSQDSAQTGINIMIAGLSFQVVSLTAFAVACAWFALNVKKNKAPRNPEFEMFTQSGKWKSFLSALALATLTIYIRSLFRVAELKEGFGGHLANEEVTFMVLEGGMIAIAVIALTFAHPGLVFGTTWAQANFNLGRSQKTAGKYSSQSSIEMGRQ